MRVILHFVVETDLKFAYFKGEREWSFIPNAVRIGSECKALDGVAISLGAQGKEDYVFIDLGILRFNIKEEQALCEMLAQYGFVRQNHEEQDQ